MGWEMVCRYHRVTSLATERDPRVSEVDVLMVGVERNILVVRQVDALPDRNQMRPTIEQTNLGSLQ